MRTKWHYQIYRKRPLLFRVMFSPGSLFSTGRLVHQSDRHCIIETRSFRGSEDRSDTHQKLISLLEEVESRPGVVVDICLHHRTTWAKIVRSPGLNQGERHELKARIEEVLATIEAEQARGEQRPTRPEFE